MNEIAKDIIGEIDRYILGGTNSETKKNLLENKKNINEILLELSNTEYSAAFIGKIGVGKTSAICKLTDLKYAGAGDELVDILKTGAGRTTVCEVRIEHAEKLSIKIDPLPNSEVKDLVRNFSEFIWKKSQIKISDEDEGGNLLSEELTRCIRHMLGLTIDKKKGDDGRWNSTDNAIEFSKGCSSVDEVNELMYGCLNLENRTEIELWPSQDEDKKWQVWLKNYFSKINDGKMKNVSIPSAITIKGSFPLVKNGCTWKVIDTRGIDSNIQREDIRVILDAEGVFPVICSSFSDAPDTDCRSFYDMGIKLGLGERIARDVTLLVLDKNESDKVSDIDEDISDVSDRKSLGRSFREEQINNRIFNDYKLSPNIAMLDCKLDSGEFIWNELELRKNSHLKSKENALKTLMSASKELICSEQNKVASFNSDVSDIKLDWRKVADNHSPIWDNFGSNIGQIFSETHHRTLAACMNRRGEFYNLDVYEAINQLARTYSVKFCRDEITSLEEKTTLLKGKYPEFENRIVSIENHFNESFSEFSMYVGRIAKEHWVAQVKSFFAIWNSMDAEWGKGAGYKSRVISHWQQWIATEKAISIHNELLRRIAASWGRVLAEK
jgi:hypothetical protein